jgi:aminopeptidase N
MIKTFAPEYAKLGPPSKSDTPSTIELRALLFKELGWYAKDPAVLAQAREITAKYLADAGSMDATLAQMALAVAARNGDSALFDQLQKVAETSSDPELQELALRMLAEFNDPSLAERSLEYSVSGKVRNQDALLQISISMEKDETRDIAWKFIQRHWDTVRTLLTPDMGTYLVASTGEFCSAEARESVKTFFADHKVPSTDRALKHAIESIDGCIELRNLQEPNLQKWIAAQPSS